MLCIWIKLAKPFKSRQHSNVLDLRLLLLADFGDETRSSYCLIASMFHLSIISLKVFFSFSFSIDIDWVINGGQWMMMLLGENVSTHDSNYLSSYTGNEQCVRQMTAIDTIDRRLLTFIDNIIIVKLINNQHCQAVTTDKWQTHQEPDDKFTLPLEALNK